MVLILGIILVCALAAVLVMPRHKVPVPNVVSTILEARSYRAQQLEEESEVVADEFRRRSDELWRSQVRQTAANLLAEEAKAQ